MANSRIFPMLGNLDFHARTSLGVRQIICVLLLALSGLCFAATAQAQNPTVAVTSPFTQSGYTTNRSAITLRGTASSPLGIQRVLWTSDPQPTAGTVKGTTSWEVDNIPLAVGLNWISITAYDFAGNKSLNWYAVTYQPEATAPQITVTSPTAGQVVAPGSNPLVAWFITGTLPSSWAVGNGTPVVTIFLYRNGVFLQSLSDGAGGMTNTSIFTFNYPEGDGYQIRIASYEGPNAPSHFQAFSGVFRIGTSSPPVISSFVAVAPNGEPGTSITAKFGEQINFRWKLDGGAATSQTINSGVGDVTGRDSKIINANQVGQFTYTLTAGNAAGSVNSQSVTVNVISNNIVNTAEVLHNGINLGNTGLGNVWPPKPADYQDTTQLPPYLLQPPAVIPINTGRQLFVDDFLIESTNLTRQFHPATMHPGNPILRANSTIESTGDGPMAMPFSNGVFYDPADKIFKMWYMCGYRVNVCYATSTDGVTWNKPSLDVVAGTNIVYKDTKLVDAYTNWLDVDEPNPARRYKMLRTVYTKPNPLEFHLHYSADGIHWSPAVVINKTLIQDRQSMFYNPFRKKWGLSIKDVLPGTIRTRRYAEHNDLSFALNSVVPNNPSSAETLYADTSKWMKADALDTAHADDPTFTPNLYAFEASGYESLMLAQFSILRGNANKPVGRPKLNEVYFGFSRDGFHWHRPNRQAMFSVGTASGAWNWGNVQPIAGGPIIVGDLMYFYFSGRGGKPTGAENSVDSNGATGLATMRRDGFASLYATSAEGSITTRRVSFDGRHLFVNAEIASGGKVCAEVLNENNQVIAPFTKANCQPFTGNATKRQLTWTGASDLSALIGQTVRFKFYVTNGKLFAFWVSPTTDGASRGFLGAGGPGYASYRDNGENVTIITEPGLKLSSTLQAVTIGPVASLNYTVNNATSASLSPAISGCTITLNNGAANGTCSVPTVTSGSVTYTLTVQGSTGQTASASATVTAASPSDTVAPVITLTSPATTTYPANTSTVKVDLTTNENATCRIAPTDVPFASMQLLTQTGGLAHNLNLTTANGQSYNYVLRCSDTAGNISAPTNISFSVANPTVVSGSNNALEFDGTTGAVTVATINALPLTREWSLETWVKTNTQAADFQTILGNNSGNDLRLTPGVTAGATVSINTGAFTHFFGQKQINDGQWHHVVAVRNLDKLLLYVDGQADTDAETKLKEKAINNPTGLSRPSLTAIGNRGTNDEWFKGQVDEARLLTRALTAQEVAARYNGGAGQPVANETGLQLGLSFNEASGNALDVSANAYSGTLKGGVTRVPSTRNNPTTGTTPQISSFTAMATTGGTTGGSTATIRLGQSVTLAWATTNATTLAISSTNCANLAPQGSCQHTPTATGQFTYTLTAQGAGQSVTRAVTLNVTLDDNVAPTISFNTAAVKVTTPTIRISGQAADNQGVTGVSFTTDRGRQGVANGTTSWSLDAPLEVGVNLITIKAVDAAGNQAAASVSVTYTSTTTDKTPPVITLAIPATDVFPLGTRQIAIEVRTNESASCRMATDLITPFAAMTPFAQSNGLVHQGTLTTADGQSYTRAIQCSDAAGNISAVHSITIRVAATASTTNPLTLSSKALKIQSSESTTEGEANPNNPK